MPKRDLLKKVFKQDLPAHTGRSNSILNRPVTLGSLAFVVFAILFSTLIYQRYLILKQTQKKQAYDMANNAKDRLQEALAYSLSATKILSFFIENDGSVKNFYSAAAQILNTNKDIDALELVPGGVIQYVYPLKGNEEVIGYDILKDSTRNKEAFKAIERKELFFSGPFELKQGGFGIVGRLPVFRNEKFWGFSAVVIKMSTLLRAAGIDSTGNSGYYYQLSKINPGTRKEEFFIRHEKEPSGGYSFSVDVPNGEWKISVAPVVGFKGSADITILSLLGFLFSFLGAIFVFVVVRRPEKLDKLVKERTMQLKESEENYKVLFQKSPLPLWIYDLETFKFLEVNDAAVNLYGYSKEEFLQMEVTGIRPKEDIDRFIQNARKGTEELSAAGVWTHFKKNGEEIQMLIFSRNISYKDKKGRLVLLMDVSEKIKVENELIKSEEKYRSLIEQASDGIILYSFDGTIHSFNKAAYTQTGYSKEEFEKLNLKDLFFEDGFAKNKSKDKKIKSDKTTTLYRKLKKKDGSVFVVELNARMLPDGKIFAIVRDITEREKAEEARVREEKTRQLIMNSALDGIVCINIEGNITLWNPQAEKIFGWSEEEIKGKRLSETIIPQQYRERHEQGMKYYLQTGQGQVLNKTIEITALDRKGREFPIELSIVPMEQDGQRSFCAFIRDITEREKAARMISENEEKYRTIIEQASDGIFIADENAYFIEVNDAGCRMLGYTKEELYKLQFTSLIPPEDNQTNPVQFDQLKTNKTVINERRLVRKDGSLIEVEISAKVLFDGRYQSIVRDITERKKADTALRESEEKYRTIIEQASDGIFIADDDTNIIDVNNAGCQMLGYTKAELLKMKYTSLLPSEYLIDNPVQIPQSESDGSVTNERRLQRKDGSLIEVEISAKVLFDGRYQSIIRDITERKKAYKALRENEEKYRALVENAPEALVVFDVEKQKFISVSESATKLFKMTKEELLKIGPIAVSPEYQPDGRSSAEAAIENIRKTIDGEKPVFEWTHCDKAGNPITCEVWLVRLPSENEILIRGSILDITERKKAAKKLSQSEEKYRLLFYNNPLPMWMATIPGLDIIDVNESAIKHYGYTREEFLKLNAKDMRPAEDVENFVNEVNKMKPGITNTRAWRHKKKDGTIIHVEIYSHEILYEGKRVWLGLSHDVTEKYKAKELLQKSYEDIRQLASNLQSIREDERTNIAREIHDELGQQLTGLKMDMHWLSRKIKSTDEEVNKKMDESIHLINATITSVRKIATDLRPSILDDLGLLAALEWQSEEFAKRSGTKVKFINKAGDITVLPEVATSLFRIYQELLTNIARHANAGLVTASLYIDDKSLYFSIADNGVGFNIDTINRKKTLGLLGIKERTLLIGGNYEIKTRPGEGSETIISMPLYLVKSTN